MISTEFDKKLAEQRAKAVLKYLIQRGILANRLTSSGFSSDEEGVLVETLELHLIGGFMEDTYSPCMQDELVVREYTTMKIDTITEDHYSYTDSLTKDFVVSVDTIMFEDTMVILERILRIDTLFQLVDKSKLTDDQILDLIIDEKADFKLADNLEDFSLQIEEMRKEEFSDMKDLIGQVFLLPDIYFDFDRDILRAKSKKILQKLYLFLDENPELLVEISGHTDSKGNDNYNLTLSQKRSKVVVKYLIQRGIHQRRLVAKGYGETNPLALNMNPDGTDNEKGRQLNRRTELRIIGINKSKIYSDVLIDFSDLTYVDNLITDYSVNTISNLVFRVQIGVFTQPADHVDFSFLKIRKIQREPLGNGTIRFTAGALSTLEAAESLRKEIIEAGVIDAYIVAYYKGRLIKIDELDKLLSE